MELGDKARDLITGFEGIVTGHTRYITGCDCYCLQPQGLDKEGKIQEGKWIDENRLAIVQRDAVSLAPVSDAKPLRAVGGPHDNEAPIK